MSVFYSLLICFILFFVDSLQALGVEESPQFIELAKKLSIVLNQNAQRYTYIESYHGTIVQQQSQMQKLNIEFHTQIQKLQSAHAVELKKKDDQFQKSIADKNRTIDRLHQTSQVRYNDDQRKVAAFAVAFNKLRRKSYLVPLVLSSLYRHILSQDEDDFIALASKVADLSISQSKKRSKS